MRKPLIAGNWKMHGTERVVTALIEGIKKGAVAYSAIDIAVLPTFIHLHLMRDLLANTAIFWGAQDIYPGQEGAFTGEISGAMLVEMGCQFVLVGHSERRHILHEDLSLIAEKFKAAIAADLTPILCVGETQAEREKGQTEQVLEKQILSVIKAAGIDSFQKAVIAYEPVWAIGTGITATPEQAEDQHYFIRELLQQNKVDIGKTIRILYGGSLKPENAASLLAMPNIDGGLVGGASLQAAQFLAICGAAAESLKKQT